MSINELTAQGFSINLSPVPLTGPQPVQALHCEILRDGKVQASAETPVSRSTSATIAEQEAAAAINAAYENLLATIEF
jgi:hypothetical protein